MSVRREQIALDRHREKQDPPVDAYHRRCC